MLTGPLGCRRLYVLTLSHQAVKKKDDVNQPGCSENVEVKSVTGGKEEEDCEKK